MEFIKEDKNKEMKEFLLSWINGSEIFITDKHPDCVFYKKNGEMVFEYNSESRHFWVDYDKTWSVFKNKFELKGVEIQAFIKNVVEDTLKCRSILPWYCGGGCGYSWNTF